MEQEPKFGDMRFLAMFGVTEYFGFDGYWHDNLIVEDNGDEFEIVRIGIIDSPDKFKLEMQ